MAEQIEKTVVLAGIPVEKVEAVITFRWVVPVSILIEEGMEDSLENLRDRGSVDIVGAEFREKKPRRIT